MLNVILKSMGKHRLITLSQLLLVYTTKKITIEQASRYAKELNKIPKRTDFIPYDDEGNLIDVKPIFKGWSMCEQTSNEKQKVAKTIIDGKQYRIYFDTASGVNIMSEDFINDNCKYSDLAHLLEGKIQLN